MVSRASYLEGGFTPSLNTSDSSSRFQNELLSMQKPPDRTAAAASDAPAPIVAGSSASMDAATIPSFSDSTTWPKSAAALNQASDVQFSSAKQNAVSGAQPDFFLGADGKLIPNPNKKDPPKDGKLNIQVDGNKSEIDAKKVADDLQKKSIKDLIGYFKKNNPKAKIPQDWLNILNSQPDLPAPVQAPGQAADAPSSSGSSQPDYVPSGDNRVGSADVGSAPSSGYRDGALSSDNGPIDRSAIPQPVAGDLNVVGPPSCTVDQIQQFLEKMGSPAAKEQGFAQTVYDEGIKHGIDPAVAVGFFLQESTCGRYGHASENHSFGNIKGEGPAGSDGEFRRYNSWSEGAKDWYNLIDNHYVHGRNIESLSQIIHVYAPNGDANNNESKYAATVKGVVMAFQADKNKTVAEG